MSLNAYYLCSDEHYSEQCPLFCSASKQQNCVQTLQLKRNTAPFCGIIIISILLLCLQNTYYPLPHTWIYRSQNLALHSGIFILSVLHVCAGSVNLLWLMVLHSHVYRGVEGFFWCSSWQLNKNRFRFSVVCWVCFCAEFEDPHYSCSVKLSQTGDHSVTICFAFSHVARAVPVLLTCDDCARKVLYL